ICILEAHMKPLQVMQTIILTGILWVMPFTGSVAVPANTTDCPRSVAAGTAMDRELRNPPEVSIPRGRRKRYISSRDMSSLLDYHNRVRSQVFPPAANMECMVWDERLAKSAESWAAQCVWEHGPPHAVRFMGQNLSINSGRYRSVVDLVRSWHDERHSFSYPDQCSGCSSMNVYGSTWRHVVFLVCNYSVKGNWVGEAPYKIGRPCSACPPSYGGSCSRNLCSFSFKSNKIAWF
ncbi:peptidase inhibitor 15-like, partial [Scleropages formosus]